MSIADRLAEVRRRINRACQEAGRDPGTVTLVAASKFQSPYLIKEAMLLGQRHFGESYAQHLRDKARLLGIGSGCDDPGAAGPPCWHFIGTLQRNKVKYVVGTATLIHSVTSERIGRAISSRAGGRLVPIMVEVNIGQEPTKTGVQPSQTLALCKTLREMPGLDLVGLMAMAPMLPDAEKARPYFKKLADMAAEGRAMGLALDKLSMGMTHDFQVAIQEGATHIRVGTAIFGARPSL